ncbi:competence/damage-inducible protein A [Desemzia sp. RIT804]|uniref:competence/damage-inducible protein A n=1 Tax=Desemzia sp. RIT 804 TaxID=2810209 RepID=UPI00194DEDBD|nr:competence/damage-inducible protein A [Desemzia sp. RIT 804]MBM6613389.1 competence/damage-inducible protein A [Desemzia sp. RIT 804]
MNAEIIAVGTELLLGQIVNSNASYLSSELASLGIDVFHHTVVGDNDQRLKEAIEIAEQRADVIIFSGGLGPTKDDITKQVLAEHLGLPLRIDGKTEQHITEYFGKMKREMSTNNQLQAVVIEGTTVLNNRTGLAAGMYLEHDNKKYILLPGPPNELKPMFKDEVIPILSVWTENSKILVSRVLRLFGIGESQLAEILDDLIENQTNPTIATYAGNNEVSIRITAKEKTTKKCNQMLDVMENRVRDFVGDYIYGTGSDTSLAQVVRDLLIDKDYRITAAESLTGGLFQSTLVNIPGLSLNFIGGLVSYSEGVKENVLGVAKKTIDHYGVVSYECATEMADRIKEMFDADIGISFTGYAGPKEIDGEKAGSVWIGLAVAGKETTAYHYHFAKDRNSNRQRTVLTGLDLVRRLLLDLPSKNVNN